MQVSHNLHPIIIGIRIIQLPYLQPMTITRWQLTNHLLIVLQLQDQRVIFLRLDCMCTPYKRKTQSHNKEDTTNHFLHFLHFLHCHQWLLSLLLKQVDPHLCCF
ncbi:hypothetical protein CWI05_01670 [Streptococcus pneumoniae]|uniref:Uncharacterized protein n=2 Tax=Streptococcus pneumoniae TaxID=1313 RepID=A0AA44MV24_STREE|nr:hypothetical protein SPAR34_0417 [Streptococcus pneumoniae GA13856]EHE38481.1 hypothetical protein SPAR96_0445 [Streptococcus pneumoniae GA47388]EHE70026.1 hypothetical protein SPAR17_0449 [Streptococcus pneumoniae GA08780]OYL25492.1 hypothetical protein A5N45_10225 [Streptococcus pneumoniae]RRR69832.1 hypothetical protein CWI10_11700 [Streptococcus pneumoniae]